jgi:hypothetical protein
MLNKKYIYALLMYVVHVVQLQAVTLHVRTIQKHVCHRELKIVIWSPRKLFLSE